MLCAMCADHLLFVSCMLRLRLTTQFSLSLQRERERESMSVNECVCISTWHFINILRSCFVSYDIISSLYDFIAIADDFFMFSKIL